MEKREGWAACGKRATGGRVVTTPTARSKLIDMGKKNRVRPGASAQTTPHRLGPGAGGDRVEISVIWVALVFLVLLEVPIAAQSLFPVVAAARRDAAFATRAGRERACALDLYDGGCAVSVHRVRHAAATAATGAAVTAGAAHSTVTAQASYQTGLADIAR